MADKPVESKINDLLKDYDVDEPTRPRGRYIEVPTQPVQWASEDGKSMGVQSPPSLMGCKDCGSVVFDPKQHDRHHVYLRQRRGTGF